MFAIEKLLCGTYHPSIPLYLSAGEKFAIMSHRLALDFNTFAYSDSHRTTANTHEMVQVEKHKRVYLGAKERFESLVTVAPSEPILVEAAATVMQHKQFCSGRAVHSILDWPGLNNGSRGEFIVANITIDTLDSLSFQKGKLKSFVIEATSYFEALFAEGLYTNNIQDALPSRLRNADGDKTFGATFMDTYIYVTHFIKIYDHSVLNDSFVMALAVRGIGIACADNQAGVDLDLPVLYKGQHLNRTNITVVMMQSKNDAKFSTTPKRYLFSAMNPFTLGIFNKGEQNPRPVFRMVYALAARKFIVHVMQRGRPSVPRESKNKDLSPNHNYPSGAIHPDDNATYQDLSKRSKEVVGKFDLNNDSTKDVTMSTHPGATSQPAHWRSFADIASITNALDGDGLYGVSDSDSGESSEWILGLSTLI
jgi:hypothetical protein